MSDLWTLRWFHLLYLGVSSQIFAELRWIVVHDGTVCGIRFGWFQHATSRFFCMFSFRRTCTDRCFLMNFMRFGCLCFASHSHLGSVLESNIFIWQFGYTCARRDNDLLECIIYIYISINSIKLFKYVKRTQCFCRVVKNSFNFRHIFLRLPSEPLPCLSSKLAVLIVWSCPRSARWSVRSWFRAFLQVAFRWATKSCNLWRRKLLWAYIGSLGPVLRTLRWGTVGRCAFANARPPK